MNEKPEGEQIKLPFLIPRALIFEEWVVLRHFCLGKWILYFKVWIRPKFPLIKNNNSSTTQYNQHFLQFSTEMQLHLEYTASIYLEYTASSCISLKQQVFGCLVQYSEILSSYSKDVFIGEGEKLRRHTASLFFPALTPLSVQSKLQSLLPANLNHALNPLSAFKQCSETHLPNVFFFRANIKLIHAMEMTKQAEQAVYVFATLPKHFYQGKRCAH